MTTIFARASTTSYVELIARPLVLLGVLAGCCCQTNAQDFFAPPPGEQRLGDDIQFPISGTVERLPAADNDEGSTNDAGSFGVEAAAFKDGDEKDVASQLKALNKKVADMDKAFKKKDEDDKKKANAFPSTCKITGFTQLDTGYYAQDAANKATVGNGQDGTGFRRVRLAMVGNVAEFTNYQVEMDFATAGRPSFFDNYVDQRNVPWLGTIRVGQYCQPFSCDAFSGFRNLMFLERSLPFLAFVPFRRVGVAASNQTEDQRTSWMYSVFRTGGFNNAPLGDDRFATDIGDMGGYSVSGRMTHLLFYDDLAEDRYLWHVGASYNFSELGANTSPGSTTNQPFYQTKVSPEFGPLGYPENSNTFGPTGGLNSTPTFADTGRYQANNFQIFGVESIAQAGAWGFQAEYMATVVNSLYAGPIMYQGAYAQIAYRVTGEHRVYDKKQGAFGKVVPFTDFIPMKGEGIWGWGALEVAARLSFVNLSNPAALNGHYYLSSGVGANTYTGGAAATAAGIGASGNGTLTDSTLGCSWFLNGHTKLQLNWIHAMLQNSQKGYSSADLLVARLQVDF